MNVANWLRVLFVFPAVVPREAVAVVSRTVCCAADTGTVPGSGASVTSVRSNASVASPVHSDDEGSVTGPAGDSKSVADNKSVDGKGASDNKSVADNKSVDGKSVDGNSDNYDSDATYDRYGGEPQWD